MTMEFYSNRMLSMTYEEATFYRRNEVDYSFETKGELLKKAFNLYRDKFSTDEILDKCNWIWEKHLLLSNRENKSNY